MHDQKAILTPKITHALALWACQGHELRNKYTTNTRVKMVDTWCRLKAYAGVSALIRNWNKQMELLCDECEINPGTLRTRLHWLKQNGFLHYDRYCIKLNSTKHVYGHLDLPFDKKNDRIFELPKKLDNEKRTHYWIYLADIADNRDRQAWEISKAALQNAEVKQWLFGVLSQRRINITEAEKDPSMIAAVLQSEYLTSFVSKQSEMYEWLTENRPDVNRGVYGMSRAWETRKMNVSYVKKKMMQQKIAFIQKLGVVESNWRARNKHVHIRTIDGIEKAVGTMWNRIKGKTSQHFCDDIMPRKQFSFTLTSEKLQNAA